MTYPLYSPRLGDPFSEPRRALIDALGLSVDPTIRECLGALINFEAAYVAHNIDDDNIETVRDSAGRLRLAADAMDAIADKMEG